MAGGQLAPPHVLSQYEWSAEFPVSTKAILTITIGNRSVHWLRSARRRPPRNSYTMFESLTASTCLNVAAWPVEDGKIGRIGGSELKVVNAEVVDGRGRTLLAGLIDAHVHFPNPVENASRQALVPGVKTQLDMFNGGDRLKLIKRLEAEDRPDIAYMRTAGTGATVPGGHPTQMGGGPIPTITAPEQAQSFVDARIAEAPTTSKSFTTMAASGHGRRSTFP
jgi:hypothetical protein